MPLIMGILAQGAGAAAAGAYDLLETQTLAGTAASVTFTGLGSYTDYKHLQLRMVTSATGASGGELRLRLNGDTGSNYARHFLIGNGSTVSNQAGTSVSEMPVGTIRASATQFSASIVDILDAYSSSKNTTVRSLYGTRAGATLIYLTSGLWQDTSSITSMTIFSTSDPLAVNSRLSLYGIR